MGQTDLGPLAKAVSNVIITEEIGKIPLDFSHWVSNERTFSA